MAGARPGGKPLDFRDLFGNDGKPDVQRWEQFLLVVQRGLGEGGGSTQNVIIQRGLGSVNAGTGGGGSGGGSSPGTGSGNPGNGGGQAAEQAPILEVQASGVVEAGMFVNYTATSEEPFLTLADNRNALAFATHYVVSITNGIAVLVPVYAVGEVIYGSGRGANTDANLYLYQEGLVTDNYDDIRNPTTLDLQPGVQIDQLLGWRISEKRATAPAAGNSLYRVSATVSIQRPQN